MRATTEQLSHFKVVVRDQLRWGEMDAMGHINNTQYFRYLESARIDFLSHFSMSFGNEGASGGGGDFALAEVRCRFKVSLTYPDNIQIGVGLRELRESEIIQQSEIYSEKLDCIAAEGDARLVYFDYAAGKRAPIPDDLAKQLQAYLL